MTCSFLVPSTASDRGLIPRQRPDSPNQPSLPGPASVPVPGGGSMAPIGACSPGRCRGPAPAAACFSAAATRSTTICGNILRSHPRPARSARVASQAPATPKTPAPPPAPVQPSRTSHTDQPANEGGEPATPSRPCRTAGPDRRTTRPGCLGAGRAVTSVIRHGRTFSAQESLAGRSSAPVARTGLQKRPTSPADAGSPQWRGRQVDAKYCGMRRAWPQGLAGTRIRPWLAELLKCGLKCSLIPRRTSRRDGLRYRKLCRHRYRAAVCRSTWAKRCCWRVRGTPAAGSYREPMM
jgi:hypothetical protein